MWVESIRENEFFNLLACMFEGSNTFACDEIPLRVMRFASDARHMGGGWMLSCKPLYFAFLKALCRMLRCSGSEHAIAISVYVVDASYCDSVHLWEYSRVV
jgi:hypothetical protein